MGKETIKKRLNQYRDLSRERDQLARALEELEARMSGPGAANMDGMPHGSGTGDPVLGIVSQHIDLQDRYRAQLDKLDKAQKDIEDMIEGLDPLPRSILRSRYICGMSWEAVCVTYGYSWRQAHNIHSKALNDILAKEQEKEGKKDDE